MTGIVKLHRVSRPQQSVSLKLFWLQMHWRNRWQESLYLLGLLVEAEIPDE